MAERHLRMEEGRLVTLDVAAATKIEMGKMVEVDLSGNAVEADGTAGHRCIGVARSTADNSSGSAGDITVDVMDRRGFWFDNSSGQALAAANVGQICYVEDDETVSLGPGTVVAGRVDKVDSSLGVLVYFDADGSQVVYSEDNVSAPPSDAELDAAFGAPARVGAGFVGVINDGGADTSGDIWICVSTGAAWHYAATTKAV